MRSTRRSSSTSNSLSVGTPGLEATASRSRARSSVVIPGEASATSDRSPAVLVGQRTTSESVSSSTSGCSSSDIGSDDIGSSRSLLGRNWRRTGLVVQAQRRSVAKSAWLARRSVVRNELGVRVRLLSYVTDAHWRRLECVGCGMPIGESLLNVCFRRCSSGVGSSSVSEFA